jgi:predicted short-subunit dehydrogenase-like oxidoreductase (DUF2520 family)
MRYVIVGTGRVGTSMAAWLARFGHDVATLSHAAARADPAGARAALAAADIVAAAIPDGALAGWAGTNREALEGRLAIHFSGALAVAGLWSYHPLFSFPRTALPGEVMDRIALQAGAPPLAAVFPGAPNPEFTVPDADRALYHALAVLSGNFAAHLWNEAARIFAERFVLPPEKVLAPYLAGIVDRFAESPLDSLTGPVARRDEATVAANLAALAGEPRLAALYRAFLASAWPERRE